MIAYTVYTVYIVQLLMPQRDVTIEAVGEWEGLYCFRTTTSGAARPLAGAKKKHLKIKKKTPIFFEKLFYIDGKSVSTRF